MSEMLKQFKIQKTVNGQPNILFVLTTGPAADTEVLSNVGAMYRSAGIKVWAYGINAKATKFLSDLRYIAYSKDYLVYGNKKSIVTPDRFTAIQDVIKKGI